MCYFRTVEEPGAACPGKISSISGANKKRCRLDPGVEDQEESDASASSQEDEDEHKEELVKMDTSHLDVVQPDEVSQIPANNKPTVPQVPPPQIARPKPSSKPAVFIPVDRSPEMQVSDSEQ